MLSISALLSTPLASSLLITHPNDVDSERIPENWYCWWDWAGSPEMSGELHWLKLVQYYSRDHDTVEDQYSDIPEQLRSLVDQIRVLQLNRSPIDLPATPMTKKMDAMSIKKGHEVNRTLSFISSRSKLASIRHCIDVGAGQGYLSRGLAKNLGMNVLALDNNEIQTAGANRRGIREVAKASRQKNPDLVKERFIGSVTHTTTHVDVRTLRAASDAWAPRNAPPTSVMFVALHACGSLTPNLLRSFLSYHREKSNEHDGWEPSALLAVGCCYNLMSPTDFPMSAALRVSAPDPPLPRSAFHLAAQIPLEWLATPDTTRAVTLALRKVVFRARLQSHLPRAAPEDALPGTGKTVANQRLGRFPNSVYESWEKFLSLAATRIDIVNEEHPTATDGSFERQLAVVHTLRCLLGPLVESLILLDRAEWAREQLQAAGINKEVELVNLFDQATGSGRNVAIVIS